VSLPSESIDQSTPAPPGSGSDAESPCALPAPVLPSVTVKPICEPLLACPESAVFEIPSEAAEVVEQGQGEAEGEARAPEGEAAQAVERAPVEAAASHPAGSPA
jgi:hypothetical protein